MNSRRELERLREKIAEERANVTSDEELKELLKEIEELEKDNDE